MIEERLSDAERRAVIDALLAQVPRSTPSEALLRLISLFSGTDTVVVCHRAYAARSIRVERRGAPA